MQVTSCQRRPTVRRGTPGSSPSNYTSPVPPNNPQQGQSREKAGRGSGSMGERTRSHRHSATVE